MDMERKLANSSRTGPQVFLLVWFGQLISLIGSGLTGFSLSFWVYGRTTSTKQLALVILVYTLPGIAIGPVAGALVDRWDRGRTMILSSLGSSLCTAAMCGQLWLGNVRAWQIGLAVAGISVCEAFRGPAYSASSTLLLRKDQYARGSGLIQLSEAIGLTVSPFLAIVLLSVTHIQVIMAIDFLTYVFLVVVLLLVQIPSPESRPAGRTLKGSLVFEAASGWRYVRARRGLLPLLGFFAVVIFAAQMVKVVIIPLLLGIGSMKTLAIINLITASGLMAGSFVMATWGGPCRRIYSVLGSGLVVGLALILAGLSPSPALVASALFVLGLVIPFGAGSDQAIWQVKIQPDMQGRVFSVRRMVIEGCLPAACIVAGLLVDKVFKPLLDPYGPLANTLGRFSGVGPARGVGLFLAVVGFLTFIVAIATSFLPSVRMIEDRLPDVVLGGTSASLHPAAPTDCEIRQAI